MTMRMPSCSTRSSRCRSPLTKVLGEPFGGLLEIDVVGRIGCHDGAGHPALDDQCNGSPSVSNPRLETCAVIHGIARGSGGGAFEKPQELFCEQPACGVLHRGEQDPASIAANVAAVGEATEVPRRSDNRRPAVMEEPRPRRQALGHEDGCHSRGVDEVP